MVVHEAEGFFDFGLGQIGQRVGRVVAFQPLDDVLGDFLGTQRAQELLPDVFLQLGDDLRALVGVQQAVEVQGFLTLERVEDVGHVLGVDFAQSRRQLHVLA